MKSFSLFLADLNDGSTLAGLTGDLDELDRIERSIEDAFGGYIEQVRAASGYVVLLGAA